MKAEVESVDRVTRKIAVTPEDAEVDGLREEIYRELNKTAKIKGFRPGKIPKSMIQAYYKDYIEAELRRKVVEGTMAKALSDTDTKPVSEPKIEFPDDDRFGYKMECEIAPEFALPAYEGVEVEVEPVRVTDEDINARIEAMRQMHTEMIDRPAGEAARKGDYVIVRYEAFHNGKPVEGVKAETYPVDLGSSNLMPEFEETVTGLKAGEEKEVEINFPADYPDKNVAGKKLLFKVLAKEVKEKRLPELGDDFAKDAGFEDMDKLRSEVIKELEKAKGAQRKDAITEQISNFLLANTDIPVPSRLLARRVEAFIQDTRSRMKTGTMSDEDERTIDAALRKDYEPEAEKRIRMGMILGRIAEQEGIRVEDGETDERLRQIAEETKRPYDYIKDFYDKYDLKSNLRESILHEKTISLLHEKAAIKEKI